VIQLAFPLARLSPAVGFGVRCDISEALGLDISYVSLVAFQTVQLKDVTVSPMDLINTASACPYDRVQPCCITNTISNCDAGAPTAEEIHYLYLRVAGAYNAEELGLKIYRSPYYFSKDVIATDVVTNRLGGK